MTILPVIDDNKIRTTGSRAEEIQQIATNYLSFSRFSLYTDPSFQTPVLTLLEKQYTPSFLSALRNKISADLTEITGEEIQADFEESDGRVFVVIYYFPNGEKQEVSRVVS